MALTGNDVHRASTISSRSKPLKSSPLAGPAVVGAISLNDNDNDSSNTASLSPSSPFLLPTRPKSVHHPLSALHSRPRSAQSISRPVSWYAYPAGEGGVGVVGTGVGGNENSEGSPHGNEDVNLNARPMSKRPSTAPGPSIFSSKANDEFSLSVRGQVAIVSTSSRQVQAQPLLGAQPTPLQNSSHVRYSNLPSVTTSTAGSAGGRIIRPTSILVDPDVPQPRPILKHRTSFVVPQLSSTTASSSRSSVLSSNSDEFGSISRSRSRLSVVSNASAGSNAHQIHQPTYIKNIDTSETGKESWYTFSPYANTPKFSRLGLASAGVVMPVSKKDAVKVIMRERRSSGVPSTSSKGKGDVTPNMVDRKSANLSEARVSISSTSEEERATQEERRPLPLPLSSPTMITTAPWLNVPSATAHGSPAHSSSSSSARTDISTSPSGSSRSSPASSVASLEVDADFTRGASLGRTEGRRGREQVVVPEDQEGKAKKRDNEKVDDECVVEVISTPRQKPKEERKTLSLSRSLKSWRSLRSSHGSTSRHDVLDVPPLASNKVLSTLSRVDGQSKEDLDEGCVGNPVALDNESGPLVLQSVVPTATDFLQLPKSDSMGPTTQPTLKKRKSASTLLARVKNWRWKKEEPPCSTEVTERGRDANEGARLVNMTNDEGVCAAEVDRQGAGGAEGICAELSNEDIGAVEVLHSYHADGVRGVEFVGVDVIVDVEGAKDNYVREEDEEEKEKDDEGSAESPYPGSTPSSTHSVPSFVPMSMMIPSPNLHVEDGRVPEFIEGQLLEGVDGQAVKKSASVEVDESSRLIEINHKPIPTAVPVFKVMNNDEELPSANLVTIDNESNGAATKGSFNRVASIAEGESDPVAVIDEGSGPVTAINDESKPVQVVAIDEVRSHTVTATVTATRSVSPSPSQQAPEALHLNVDNTSHTSTIDEIFCSTIQDPSSTHITILDQAPSQAFGHHSMPLAHSESVDPGRSSTRSSRNRSRRRSSSARRMWNTFVCGGAEAEQMAVADAWTEIQADRRGRPIQQGKNEEDRAAAVRIFIAEADPGVSSEVSQSRHSFSNIGTAL